MNSVDATRDPTPNWRPARHPSPYRFSFTIVHDADSAYSGRLAPLFEAFDAMGFRVTVSAFAFWAAWANEGAIWNRWRTETGSVRHDAPIAVPLCDPDEYAFYRDLERRGHEIALHSPSDTSSARGDVVRAFDEFTRQFAHRPTVYVEHSARSNKDALSHEGANSESPHYCLDLLRDYAPWIWVDGPGALRQASDRKYFEIPPDATFANAVAASRYGLPKAFLRTGRWTAPGGDGFLECYSIQNLRTLEQDGGMALVYTHLDDGWLDPLSRRMRSDIRDRLEYLATRPGWFAPAGQILDRARAIDDVHVVDCGDTLTARNDGRVAVDDLVLTHRAIDCDLPIGSLGPGESRTVAVPPLRDKNRRP